MKQCAVLLVFLCLMSCGNMQLFEKTIQIQNQEWKSDFQPTFIFNIPDSTQPYNVYFFIRHRSLYEFNNLWINMFIKSNVDNQLGSLKYELTLANNNIGWLGNTLGDVVEQYILLTPTPIKFHQGENKLILAHIMRQDPLKYILNVGLRVTPAE